jgi:hypothetical protein
MFFIFDSELCSLLWNVIATNLKTAFYIAQRVEEFLVAAEKEKNNQSFAYEENTNDKEEDDSYLDDACDGDPRIATMHSNAGKDLQEHDHNEHTHQESAKEDCLLAAIPLSSGLKKKFPCHKDQMLIQFVVKTSQIPLRMSTQSTVWYVRPIMNYRIMMCFLLP